MRPPVPKWLNPGVEGHWRLAVQSLPALDAVAVASEVVMAARCAHEPAWGVSLEPALTLSAIPDAVLGTEHPAPCRQASMRRTNSRSSRSRANGARRASSSRSRSARSKRSSRPHLTQRQVREITGTVLILVGLLGALAVATHAGSILAGLQQWLTASFGAAWFVPVVGAVALGAYMLWPQAPRPRLKTGNGLLTEGGGR